MICLCPLLSALLSSNPPAFSQILEITPRALALTAPPPDICVSRYLSSFKSSFNYHLRYISEIFPEHLPPSPLTYYSFLALSLSTELIAFR